MSGEQLHGSASRHSGEPQPTVTPDTTNTTLSDRFEQQTADYMNTLRITPDITSVTLGERFERQTAEYELMNDVTG